MKIPHLLLTLLASCLCHGEQIVFEDFSSPSKNGGNNANGYLGAAGTGYDYNGAFGTWLYSSGNMGIDDAASGDGSSSSSIISSTGQLRVQDFRGTNARAASVVFEGDLFTHGVEYTVSFDVTGDAAGDNTGRYWLAEVFGYSSGGTFQITGSHGGWANGANKPFAGSGGASVNYLADYVALNGENFAGTFPVEFTFTYDATNSPDIAFAVGTYNNIYAIDNFRITGPDPLPTVTTVIQFGGQPDIITDAAHITQIGGGTQIDQIISWAGASSEGGTASGSVGGGSAKPIGSTLSSETFGLTLESVGFAGAGPATGTLSSGSPNVLGVAPNAGAKFDAGTPNESWTFDFNEAVKLRQLVVSAFAGSDEVTVTIPGVLAATSLTLADMAPITYGSTSSRYVYTFPQALDVPADTGITLEASAGQWGLQAVVVEFEYTPPPVTIPDAFDPNPDGGIEPTPLTRLDPAPNVIIFIADDMGIGDTSAYQDLTGAADDVQIDTPEMERLADMGTRFTDVHTNGATCSPTRIALLSGTYSLRSPLKMAAVQDSQHTKGVILPGRRTTIAHMMQRAGFATYGYGKWHMALRGDSGEDTNSDGVIDVPGTGLLAEGPIESGFDTWTGTPGNFSYAGAMIQDNQYVRFGSASPADYSLVPINDPSAQPWKGHGPASPTDPNLYKVQPAVFEKLKADMDAHMDSRGNEPFFIYYASHSNHDPWVPANYEPNHPDGPRASLNGVVIDTAVTKAGGMIEIQTVPDFSGDGIPDPDYSVYGGDGTDWIWSDALRVKMWDHVSAVDAQGNLTINGPTNRAMMVQENDVIIGYMLDFLEQTDDPRNPGYKLIDNTIFIFTSDNGADARSEVAAGALPQSADQVITDLRAFKGSRYEGGNRVPFIAAWPEPGDPAQTNGIPAGKTSPAVFGLNDIYATIAEAIGYRLHAQEAVDSESLLADWTDSDQIETAVTVRETDMLSKYQQFVFSRRGEFKLAAEDVSYPGTLTPQKAKQDRFSDNSTLDYVDMGFTDLFDLSNDLSEQSDIGQNGSDATAADMLNSMQQMLTQGYSRAGAAAFENGLNFIGGDLFTDSNWHAYKASRNGTAAGSTTPGIIAENGTASGDILNRTYVHRAATIDYSPASGGLVGSLYELDGGTLNVDESLRMTNSRLEVFRGAVELGVNHLELNGSNCVVILSGGEVNVTNLSVGGDGTSAGFKVVRFRGGAGSLNLAGGITFIDDGDTANDFIDFVSGSRGRLVSTLSMQDFSDLWDASRLRIDGAAGTVGQFNQSDFKLIALGDGRNALVLDDGDQIVGFDYDGDRISDLWEQATVGAMNVLSLTGDNDGDGILDREEYILDFDPTVPDSPFAVSVVWNSGNSVGVNFGSKLTRNYLIQFCQDLNSSTWTALNYQAGNNGLFTFNDNPGGAASGFYRVQIFVP